MGYLIEAHSRHLRVSGYSDKTIADREVLLHRLHDWLPLGIAYATTDQLQEFLDQTRRARWTLLTYVSHLRGFYGWADGVYLDGDPTTELARPRRPRSVPNPVTNDELVAALRGSPDPWYTIINLAYLEGLRVSEIANLDRRDVGEDRILIRHGKGGDPATVATHPHVWELVCALGPTQGAERRRQPVVTHKGRPVTGRWISANARHHFDRLGLRRVHMHMLRHWHATQMIQLGWDALTVQQAMRHASSQSTEGYVLIGEARLKQAVSALPVLVGAPASA